MTAVLSRSALLALVWTAPLLAQQPAVVRLAKPDARLAHEFSAISGLLELPDGQVLVSDGIDETLLRIDLRTGIIDTVGRTGQGPGEYKGPDLIFPGGGGSVMLVDLGNARLSFFDASLKYKESVPIVRGEPGRGMTMVVPQAVDGQGRIYFQGIMRDPGQGRADSGFVLRFDRVRNTTDTVAKVKLGEVKVTSSGGANNRSMSMAPVPLSPDDQWGVASDGRIAVARMVDYHLEWIGADGKVIRGAAVPYQPIPIRDADKKEWVGDMSQGLSIRVMSDNGRMNVQMGRGGAGARDRDAEQRINELEWPARKPAFRSVRVAPDGIAWVERSVAAGSPREYDLIGADGRMVRRVVLPARRRLAGFGKGVVYLRETTADELQYLERYRL